MMLMRNYYVYTYTLRQKDHIDHLTHWQRAQRQSLKHNSTYNAPSHLSGVGANGPGIPSTATLPIRPSDDDFSFRVSWMTSSPTPTIFADFDLSKPTFFACKPCPLPPSCTSLSISWKWFFASA